MIHSDSFPWIVSTNGSHWLGSGLTHHKKNSEMLANIYYQSIVAKWIELSMFIHKDIIEWIWIFVKGIGTIYF